MTYDGTTFKPLDEDAYAADRPMSTALDHGVRNNLAHLARRGWQCSYYERLTTDLVPTPMYSGNPSTLLGPLLIRMSPGCSGFTYEMLASGGPVAGTGLEVAGQVWLSVISDEFGEVNGPRVDIAISTAEDDYAVYSLSVDFDEIASREQFVAVHVMFVTTAYNVDDADVDFPSSSSLRAIDDPGSASFDRSQAAAFFGTNDSFIEILLDLGQYAHGAPIPGFMWVEGVVVDLSWIRHVGGQLAEVRDDVPLYDAWGIRAHDSVSGAQILPVAEAGKARANYDLSEDALARWHVSSIGVTFNDGFSGGSYGEYPRWYGLSNQDTDFGPSTGRMSFVALTEAPRILVTLPVIPFVAETDQIAFSAREITYTYDVETFEPSLTDGVELRFEAEVVGESLSAQTDYADVTVYRLTTSGEWPFFAQMIPRHFDEDFNVRTGPEWTYREGQLFDVDGGVNERNLITPLVVEIDASGLTPGEVYSIDWEISYLQTMTAHIETLIVGQPVVHQFLTDEVA